MYTCGRYLVIQTNSVHCAPQCMTQLVLWLDYPNAGEPLKCYKYSDK